MKQKWKFQKGVKLYIMEGTTIRILFDDGKTKEYDVKNIFDRFPHYKCLEDRKLFLKAHLLGCGGVGWTPDIDLSVDTVYYEGIDVKSEEDALQYVIGFKVKQERLKKELSQEEFSKLTGVDQSSISKLEKGQFNPSIKQLEKILKPLGKHLEINIK
mgnify:CR=1 FL=1